MAKRNSTPSVQRHAPTRNLESAERFVQRAAWDIIEIDECLRDVHRYLKRLKRAARASQRLGSRIYWQIRVHEKRR